jgi:hypothetical protein
MNKVLAGPISEEMQYYRDQGHGINEARRLVITDRMFSAIAQSQIHIENGNLKEAVELQNDLLMTLITETRGRR